MDNERQFTSGATGHGTSTVQCEHEWHNGGTVYVTATGLSYDDIYCQLCGATAAPVFQDGRVVGYLKSIQ